MRRSTRSRPRAPTDHLSVTFAALADPTRRAILARRGAWEASGSELREPFRMSQPAISRHLRVLERAGLVSKHRDSRWRPRRIEAKPLAELNGWLEEYRKFWEESFNQLDKVLEGLE